MIKVIFYIISFIFISSCRSNVLEDINKEYSFSKIKIYISSPDIKPNTWADISFDNLENSADIEIDIKNGIDKFVKSLKLNNLVECSKEIKFGFPHLKILLINKKKTYVFISDGEKLATNDLKYCMSLNSSFMDKFNVYK